MPAAEQKKSYQVIKQFKGLNTKANRTAIDESEFSWIENVMPIGFGNLKVVPTYLDTGIRFAKTVVNGFVVNLANVDYFLAFESDGSLEAVNLQSLTIATVAPAGTFTVTTVGTNVFKVSQWENLYALILDANKGYFTWDGSHLVPIGSLSGIGITYGGTGYTQAPTVTISAPGTAGGQTATAICTITNTAGEVLTISVTSVGSGYTSVPTVTLSDPPPGGVRATAAAAIASGQVVAISVVTPGSGYTSNPSVSITGGGGAGAAATANVDRGSVNSIILTNAGSGYTSAPTVTFSGGNATNNATAVAGYLTFATGSMAIEVTNGGSEYTNAANVVVTITGDGTNAAGTAIVSGGQVTQVIMTNPGSGYTHANVTITGGGANVNATAQAIVTTNTSVGIESFSGRVWLAQGRTVFYTAAGDPFDFISISAGNIILADSTLHGNIVQLLSANNFLYVWGDDSINVFSDVRVTNAGQTLFTNTNISASVGSRKPYAIFPYFRSVLFMNDYGAYALVGSTTTKISDALDGIIPYIDQTKPITAAQVLIENILCAAFNFYYKGPLGTETTSRYVQAVFFDKKWFLTSQNDNVYLIHSAPVAGLINMYGTDGSKLYQLYADKTSNISSYIQTALLPMGDPIRTKQALKFGVEAVSNAGNPITVSVDAENGQSTTYNLSGDQIQWQNNFGQITQWANPGTSSNIFVDTWINGAGATTTWGNASGQNTVFISYLITVPWSLASTYFLYKSDASQWGKYIGLTVQATTPQMVFSTFEFEHELRVRF